MKNWLIILLLLCSSVMRANHWNPDPFLYQDNMNLVAVLEINGIEQGSPDFEVGVFCGDECRGSELLTYYTNANRYLLFLTVYGTTNDVLSFRLYNHQIGQELEVQTALTITFVANAIIGTPSNPYPIPFEGANCMVSLMAFPEQGGIVLGMGAYPMGTIVTITEEPHQYYLFEGWFENGQLLSTEQSLSFLVLSDRTIQARFSRPAVEIVALSVPEAGGTIQGAGPIPLGDNCRLVATCNEGYDFQCWKENGIMVSSNPIYEFEVTGTRMLEAQFLLREYVITVDAQPQEGGIVTGGGIYSHDSIVSMVAEPNDTYFFIHWEENGEVVSTQAEYVFLAQANRHLTALFSQQCYTVSVACDENQGTMWGTGNYVNGTVCTLRAQPAEGYHFVSLTENGEVVTTEPEYSFTVTGDRSFEASFAINQYEVTLSAYPNNAGTVTGAGTYTHGETVTVTVTPVSPYFLEAWVEDGTVVSVEQEYTFVIQGNRNLVARLNDNYGVHENYDSDLYIYPNPVNDVMSVVLEQEGRIDVFDANGRRVFQTQLKAGVHHLDVSSLKEGLYMLLYTTQTTEKSLRFIRY